MESGVRQMDGLSLFYQAEHSTGLYYTILGTMTHTPGIWNSSAKESIYFDYQEGFYRLFLCVKYHSMTLN